MTYILLIGDTHIPDRAYSIPHKLANIIDEGKPWDIAVFTGDFTGEEVFEWFTGLARKTYYVSGNMDYLPLPRKQVFEINNIPVGVHHGDGVYPRGDTRGLTRIANELRVKLLFTGHTHSLFIKHGLTKNLLLVNPGSLTGVWGGGGGSMKPSMIVLEVNNSKFIFNIYELEGEKLNITTKKAVFENNIWRLT